MQDGEVWPRGEKKAGASESSESSWYCASAERPKEAKADFQDLRTGKIVQIDQEQDLVVTEDGCGFLSKAPTEMQRI